MSYLVLARKYRPRTFADMVGQEVAANTLRGAIAEARVAHAYLFHGPRGTGKTTSARIFAKALNCERGPTPEPCGECERCKAADANAEADLIELDAASNRGIDSMRDLLAQVPYAPMRARFKVYILDEAHMLTKEASNALLKTLEEPPAHVKFFLATTEPEKILATIRSRCQIVQLAPLAEKQMAERLEWVFAREGIQAEPGIATELARRARGGLRDALSAADQLLSLAGSKPKLADLERLAGAGGADELDSICAALEAHDGAAVLGALPATRGGEIELCGGLLEHVRAMLVLGLCGAEAPFVEADSALRAKLHERARRLGAERLQLWLEDLLAARERMRFVPAHARIVLESALLGLARPETVWPIAEIADRIQAIEERLARADSGLARPSGAHGAHGASTDVPRPEVASPRAPESVPPRAPANGPTTFAAMPVRSPGGSGLASMRAAESAPPPSRSAPPSEPHEVWKLALVELERGAASVAEVLRGRGRLVELGAAHALVRFANPRPEERTLLAEPRNRRACVLAFARVLGREIDVRFADAEPVTRAPQDAFTTKVNELFQGRIEDDA